MSDFLDKRLSALVPYTPGEQPKGIKGLIKLNTNENPFPPSLKVVKALGKESIKGLRLYPDPSCTDLRKAIGSFYDVDTDRIFVGNGSDEILAFCFYGFCQNGAAFPDITYGFYPVFSDMFGIKYKTVALKEDFSIDVKDYENIKATIFIANPNAPTGLCLPTERIEELLIQDKNRLVVVDEAYIDFGGESSISLLKKHANLLIVNTFSKSRQMAGARLAFAIGDKGIIDDLNTMKYSFNPYSANRAALIAGEAAMKDREYFEKCKQKVIENREYCASALKNLGFRVLNSAANFIFVSPRGMSGREYYEALRENGILVRYFDRDRLKDFVRISIGTRDQMDTLVSVTESILR